MPVPTTIPKLHVDPYPWKPKAESNWQIPSKQAETDAEREFRFDEATTRCSFVLDYRKRLGPCKTGQEIACLDKARLGGFKARTLGEVQREWGLNTWNRIALDSGMQAYFLRMGTHALKTCHPSMIRQQAQAVLDAYPSRDLRPITADVVGIIIEAATDDMAHSRSVALFVHELVLGLESESSKALVWGLQERLAEDLKTLWGPRKLPYRPTDIPFDYSGSGQTGLDFPPDLDGTGVNDKRWLMLKTTAFLGDLFAVGVIGAEPVLKAVNYLISCLRSLFHLRNLHLLLSRCVYVAGERISSKYLRNMYSNISTQLVYLQNNAAQWWRIELEALTLRMLDQIGQDQRSPEKREEEGQLVMHERSLKLSSSKIFQRIDTWLANRTVKEEEMQLSP